MKKPFVLLVVFLLALPVGAQAFFLVPSATVVVVVNTVGDNGSFDFRLRDSQPEPAISLSFSIATRDNTGSQSSSVDFPDSSGFNLTQTLPEGWQSTSVNCESNEADNSFRPIDQGAHITISAFTTTTCTFTNTKIPSKTPVLIVPGIMGTEIFKDSELLWPDVKRMLLSVGDSFMDPLAFKEDGNPLDTSLQIRNVLAKPAIKFDYAKELMDDFQSQNYTLGTNLFLFPYDWRRDLDDTAVKADPALKNPSLKQTIDKILSDTGASKIDIVAHSQGGLVVKRLLYDLPAYQSKINKLVFVGTPHLGAPKAAKALLYGDSFGVDFLGLGLAPEEIKKIGLNMPAVYQLLPSAEYFNHTLGYLGTDESVNQSSPVPHIVTKNFSQSQQFLKDSALNGNLADAGAAFHKSDYDNFNFSGSGIEAYNLIGCQSATIGKIVTFGPDSFQLLPTAGDGTVPAVSASNLSGVQTFYSLTTDDLHGTMLTHDGTRQKIINLITGSSLATGKITTNAADCHFQGQQISVHSPLDLSIHDELGNHTGPQPDGTLEFGVPGVTYDTIGTDKFIFLPPGHTYTINLSGTGAGTATVEVRSFDNEQTLRTETFSNFPVTTQLQGSLQINAGLSALSLDTDGNGTTDQTLQPDRIVAADDTVVSAPTASPPAGTYSSAQAVVLSAPANNVIHFTLDGSAPSCASSPIFSSALNISATQTLKAVSCYQTLASSVSSFSYTINPPPAPPSSGGGGGGRNYDAYPLPEPARPAAAAQTPKAESQTPPKSLVAPAIQAPPSNNSPVASLPQPPNPPAEGKVLGVSIQAPASHSNSNPVQDGTLVLDTSDGRTIYMLGRGGIKRGFTTPQALFKFGYTFSQALPFDASQYPEGVPIKEIDTVHPDGSLLIHDGVVWWLNFGKLNAFPSPEVFTAYGFDFRNVVPTLPADLALPRGEVLQGKNLN